MQVQKKGEFKKFGFKIFKGSIKVCYEIKQMIQSKHLLRISFASRRLNMFDSV